MKFFNNQQYFIKNISAKFAIPGSSQSPVTKKNSNSQISGQSLINENCQNSKTSDDIEMKLRNKTWQGKHNNVK